MGELVNGRLRRLTSPPPDLGVRDYAPSTLAFVLNAKVYRVGDRCYAPYLNVIDVLVALSEHVHQVVLCAPTAHVAEVPETFVELPPQLIVHELPFYGGHLSLLAHAPLIAARLLRHTLPAMQRWDLVGAVAPSGIGLFIALIRLALRRHLFLYVRGNPLASLRSEYEARPWQGLLTVVAFWPLDVLTRLLAASGVIVVTMGAALARRYPGKRVCVLPGYGSSAVLGRVPVVREWEPAQLRKLLYVGRLSREKGVDVLLRALGELAHDGEAFSLTVVGDGPDGTALAALVTELGLVERVAFEGHVTDADRRRSLYLDAGIVVIPSRTEGVPLVAIEAMALGRVVVASAVGGIPDIVEDGWSGLLVGPEHPDAVAAAIRRAWIDPELASTLASNAREASRDRTADAMARTILDSVASAR